MRPVVEICIDSAEGARAAHTAGADRVELCASLFEGGLTPSAGLIAATRAASPIRLHVIIRPRGGDFLYGPDEARAMLHDIAVAKSLGADGIVIGALTAEGEVDKPLTRELIAAARPLPVTFHRAFDMAREPFQALDDLIGLGVDRLLTSGQEASVPEGAELIAELIRRAGDRLIVMPGGGITARNVARVLAMTHAREIHFAALASEPGPMRHRNPAVFMGGELRLPEYARTVTSPGLLAEVMAALPP